MSREDASTKVNKAERLSAREALPDALKVLLADYPREAWYADPGFGDLIRFWLDRHLMFRRLLGMIEQGAQSAAEGKTDRRRFAAELSRLGSMFAGELHGHHMIEDHHYFPHLRGLDARLEHGFDLLDSDHHDLDAHLAGFAENANAVIRSASEGIPSSDPVRRFIDGLNETGRFLDRHLTDEEDLIVPVLLKHGSSGVG